MKKIILCLIMSLSFILCGCAKSTPPEITFSGERYILASSTHSSLTDGWINEYILSDGNLNNPERIITVSTFPYLNNTLEAAKKLDSMLKNIENAATTSQIFYNTVKDDAILDYVSVIEGQNYAEFGIMKYGKNNEKGLKSIHFVYKYLPEITDYKTYKTTLVDNRKKWAEEMSRIEIPDPYKKEYWLHIKH